MNQKNYHIVPLEQGWVVIYRPPCHQGPDDPWKAFETLFDSKLKDAAEAKGRELSEPQPRNKTKIVCDE